MGVTGMMAGEVMGRGGEGIMESRWSRCHGVKDEKEK